MLADSYANPVLPAKNGDRARAFYRDVLGLTLSDYGSGKLVFFHCNPRHHSLAMINECYGMQSGQVHHVMLEALSLDQAAAIARAWSLVHGFTTLLLDGRLEDILHRLPEGTGVDELLDAMLRSTVPRPAGTN